MDMEVELDKEMMDVLSEGWQSKKGVSAEM